MMAWDAMRKPSSISGRHCQWLRGCRIRPCITRAGWNPSIGWRKPRRRPKPPASANPRAFFARYLLLKIYSQQKNRQAYDNLMQDSLRLAYNDETARRYLEERATAEKRSEVGAPAHPPSATPPAGSPEALLNLSAKYCNDGAYEGCIEMAKKALELRPGYAEAYNNMAAGYSSLEKWDDAIQAASEAIRLKPDYPLARKNLDWAVTHKQQAQKGGR